MISFSQNINKVQKNQNKRNKSNDNMYHFTICKIFK